VFAVNGRYLLEASGVLHKTVLGGSKFKGNPPKRNRRGEGISSNRTSCDASGLSKLVGTVIERLQWGQKLFFCKIGI